MCPELGFELPKTLAIVHRELDAMGLSYTDKYCRSSAVSVINDEKKGFTIGLRADMDALPIQEEVDVPYKSRIDGQMHACGHDFHTATLLAVGKYLVDHKEELNCRVKLMFSPAEEYEDSGCRYMAENGVMDDVDCALTLHVSSVVDAGKVQVHDAGGSNANTMAFRVDVHGKAAHAAAQHNGRDAVLMTVELISALENMIAKEIDGRKCKILNIGSIHGGKTNNVICDHVELYGTVRTWDDDVNEYIKKRMEEICQGIALATGGKIDLRITKFVPYLVNHPKMVERLHRSAVELLGEENVVKRPRTLGGEDFAFLSRRKPAAQFKVGIKPEVYTEKIVAHSGKFYISTDTSYQVAIDTFVKFVFDNMNGIDFE